MTEVTSVRRLFIKRRAKVDESYAPALQRQEATLRLPLAFGRGCSLYSPQNPPAAKEPIGALMDKRQKNPAEAGQNHHPTISLSRDIIRT